MPRDLKFQDFCPKSITKLTKNPKNKKNGPIKKQVQMMKKPDVHVLNQNPPQTPKDLSGLSTKVIKVEPINNPIIKEMLNESDINQSIVINTNGHYKVPEWKKTLKVIDRQEGQKYNRNENHEYYYEGDSKIFTSKNTSLNLSKLPNLKSNKSKFNVGSKTTRMECIASSIDYKKGFLDKLISERSRLKEIDSGQKVYQSPGMKYLRYKRDLSCIPKSISATTLRKNQGSETFVVTRHKKSLPQLRKKLRDYNSHSSNLCDISRINQKRNLDPLYYQNPASSISIQTFSPKQKKRKKKRFQFPQIIKVDYDSEDYDVSSVELEWEKELKTLEQPKKNEDAKKESAPQVKEDKILDEKKPVIPPIKVKKHTSRNKKALLKPRKKASTLKRSIVGGISSLNLSGIKNYGNSLMKS
ncbi:unnamed protein product [Moneuplotes crassus]|uniref:Uncharacterized protein n=1 Tax=Euplotes crassus TaxID=5936 RepID=A0AAD1UAI3_EUPCR|nr:unnamed protein product [Moneuplotes crassus]